MRFFPRTLLVVVFAFLPSYCAARPRAQTASTGSVSEHFLLDHNHVFVELTFVLPDGKRYKRLALVDSGEPWFDLTNALSEKQKSKRDVFSQVLFGGKPLDLTAVKNVAAYKYFYPGMYMFPGQDVEANLPATILEKYDVLFDYAEQTLTLAPPKSLKHQGVRVPCRVDQETGLVSVQAEVAGKSYGLAIDISAAYTWIDRSVTESWAKTHPQWLRGIGAVGDANMNGSYAELTGMIMRIPDVGLGGLDLQRVGALGVGPGFDKTIPNFFAWYSEKTPGPVIGFLGGNVIRRYQLEIDYADGATYWKGGQSTGSGYIDQVGIMIRPTPGGRYFVARVATKKGKKTVEGVEAGGRLISVDGMAVTDKTMGEVLAALHGTPAETRILVLERRGERIIAKAAITGF